MQKVRVHEIAKELGMKSKDVIDKGQDLNLDLKTASSAISAEEAEELLNYIMTGKSKLLKTNEPQVEVKKVEPKEVKKEPEVQKVIEHPKAEEKIEPKEIEAEELVPQAAPRQEIEKEVVPKKQPEIAEERVETLAQATVMKRRKLVFVKKAERKGEEEIMPEFHNTPSEAPIKKPEIKTTLNQLFEQRGTSDDTSMDLHKKKKKVKKAPAPTKKESAQKIDILADRDLGEDFEDEDENEVVLMDLTIKDEEVEEKKKVDKKLDNTKVKSNLRNLLAEQTFRRRKKKKSHYVAQKEANAIEGDKVVEIQEDIRAYEFADKVGRSVAEVIKVLFNLGKMITKNDFLSNDEIEILAHEFGVEIELTNPMEDLDYLGEYHENEDEEEDLVERPPVVTIMGHVDHGKTSLLDKIRNARVAAGEAGGITQHIGAYMVEKNGKKIAFIDTPGHEAFTEMRARGAQVTDIAIIVVAADDGVKPQTVEALNHAKAAGVPIIFAVNKIDKPDANPDKVKAEASDLGYMPVEWGGNHEFVHVSALQGTGIEDLLETILLQAEIMELKANPNKEAKAVIVESSLEKGMGPVATAIVQNGTLKVGDSIVVDTAFGRVRALIDDQGKNIQSIGPSEMAVVTGLNAVPPAGSVLIAVDSDATARNFAQKRLELARQKELSKSTKVSFDELSELVRVGQLQSLPIIIKSDVQGSLEAIKGSLEKIVNEEVKINIVHAAVGGITESDVILAGASQNSVILGFNIRPTNTVKVKAKELGVQIKTYSIIYDLIDDVKAIVSGMMSPVTEEEIGGYAEVRDTFSISKVGTIAGCFVTDGAINRNSKVRLIRDGVVVYTSNISSLKRFKDDAREVTKGYECGIMLDGYNDIRVGDVFETFKEVQRQREA